MPRYFLFIFCLLFLGLSLSACKKMEAVPSQVIPQYDLELASEESDTSTEAPASEEDAPVSIPFEEACYQEMSEQGKRLTEAQIKFYTDVFASDQKLEKKIVFAQEYLRFIKVILNSILHEHEKKLKNEAMIGANQRLLECYQRQNDIIEISEFFFRSMLEKYADDSPAQALNEMLIRFNENLSSLQLNSADVFQMKLKKLENSLPCFAVSCLNEKLVLPPK